MIFNKNKNFCDIHPICYKISSEKNILLRNMRDLKSRDMFATNISNQKLPNIIDYKNSTLIKKGRDIDPTLQINKAINIKLACQKISGIIIKPNEIFSFWRTIGRANKKNGYKEGRVIVQNKLIAGVGGGLCNLSNTIHRLVLHSPLEVVEFHKHSDALAPVVGERIPFSSGTSVSYNYIDYRFKNNSNQNIQLILWCDEEKLHGELRSENEFPLRYELIEEDYHFKKKNNKYYQISKVYKNSIDKTNNQIVAKELVLDNNSEVMYAYDLIPKDKIRS